MSGVLRVSTVAVIVMLRGVGDQVAARYFYAGLYRHPPPTPGTRGVDWHGSNPLVDPASSLPHSNKPPSQSLSRFHRPAPSLPRHPQFMPSLAHSHRSLISAVQQRDWTLGFTKLRAVQRLLHVIDATPARGKGAGLLEVDFRTDSGAVRCNRASAAREFPLELDL